MNAQITLTITIIGIIYTIRLNDVIISIIVGVLKNVFLVKLFGHLQIIVNRPFANGSIFSGFIRTM